MISALQKIIEGQSPWDPIYEFENTVFVVYPHAVFVDEINNYPSISVIHRGERIEHLGGGVRLHRTVYEIRGYTHDESVEQAGESLASDIEHVFEHYRQWADGEDYRITSIQTDGGVLSPLGICIITVEELKCLNS